MATTANHPETAVAEGRAVAIFSLDIFRAELYIHLTAPGVYDVNGIDDAGNHRLIAHGVSAREVALAVGRYYAAAADLDDRDWLATAGVGQTILSDPDAWVDWNIAQLVTDMTCRDCGTDFVGVPHPSSERASINSAGLYTCDRCNDLL